MSYDFEAWKDKVLARQADEEAARRPVAQRYRAALYIYGEAQTRAYRLLQPLTDDLVSAKIGLLKAEIAFAAVEARVCDEKAKDSKGDARQRLKEEAEEYRRDIADREARIAQLRAEPTRVLGRYADLGDFLWVGTER